MKYPLFLFSLLLSFTLSAQLQDCDITAHRWEVLEYDADSDSWNTVGKYWSKSYWEIRYDFHAFMWEEDDDFQIQWWEFDEKLEEGLWRYYTEHGNAVIFNANDNYILHLTDYDEEVKSYTRSYFFTKLEIKNLD